MEFSDREICLEGLGAGSGSQSVKVLFVRFTIKQTNWVGENEVPTSINGHNIIFLTVRNVVGDLTVATNIGIHCCDFNN